MESTPPVPDGSSSVALLCFPMLTPMIVSMADTTSSKLAQKQDEPLFLSISKVDPAFEAAYDRAHETLPRFIEHIQSGADAYCSAKLRFRDPDESERLGEDRYLFLWLFNVVYDPADNTFVGTFVEVPSAFQRWHSVGQHLQFEGDSIFDWMVLSKDGHLFGGYTLRVAREKLPESERADYDRYVGVTTYEAE